MANIEEHRVVAFGRELFHVAQQESSRFAAKVSEDTIVGKRGTVEYLDNAADPSEVATRHQPTVLTDPAHIRRNVIVRDYALAAGVDEEDLNKVFIDPRNGYSRSLGMSFGRKIDNIIIPAMRATAITGEEGTGTAAFDAGTVQTHVIAHGSAGMTIAKMRQSREILEAEEEMEDEGMNRWYLSMQSRQRYRDLLATTEATSSDFNTVKALVNGQINTFLGFEFVKSQNHEISSTTRYCLAWNKSAMLIGYGKRPAASLDKRPDLNNTWQVLYKGTFGATRLRESGVVEIQCTEA